MQHGKLALLASALMIGNKEAQLSMMA
jgi:hypothetical protein